MRRALTLLAAGAVSAWGLSVQAGGPAEPGRTIKRDGLTFRLASSTAVAGFDPVRGDRAGSLFVAPKSGLSEADLISAQTVPSAGGSAISMTLTSGAADRLVRLMREHHADRLAVYQGSTLIAAGTLSVDATTSRAAISDMAEGEVAAVTNLLRATGIVPAGPVLTLVPSSNSIQSGETINVDVFVSGVADLRAYQVSLEAVGGDGGRLAIGNVQVQSPRSDFVFAGMQKLDAADVNGGRVGSVLYNGGVDVAGQGYLGTFTMTASSYAAGTFIIRTRTDANSSMLLDSANDNIAFTAADGVPVAVGIPTTRTTPIKK